MFVVVFVKAQEFSSIVPGILADSIHLIVEPLARILPAVGPAHCTHALYFVFIELPYVLSAIFPFVATHTML